MMSRARTKEGEKQSSAGKMGHSSARRQGRKARWPGRAREQSGPTSKDHPVLHLQRSRGNQAVQRLFPSGAIQAKLRVNRPSDPYEQEADDVAEQVMRMPEPAVQRTCACGNHTISGGECSECSKKKRGGLQTKLKVNDPDDIYEQEADRIADQVIAAPAYPGARRAPPRIRRFTGQPIRQTEAVPASVDQTLSDPGKPLEPQLRQDMEKRFGSDFSGVRVHSDAAAEQSAREVDAKAYTVGHDIVFGTGELAPGTREGRRLIAHELVHVVQQQAGGSPMIAQRASLGEKWSAFWGAGPVDAYRASKLAEEALKAAQETGLPGLHNGPADAWRHCYWNCRMTQVIGEEDAADIAEIHEEHGNNPTAERMMDTWNNEEGRKCSGDCDSCCQSKLDAGKLWVLYGGKVGASKPTPRTGTPGGEKYEDY